MRLIIAFACFWLLGACASAADPAPDAAAPPSVRGTLLVGNKGEDSLSFIDLATGREVARAKTGRMPHEIAISPDGREAAVVAYGARSIDIFDIVARTRTRTIDLSPNEGPHGLVWLPDGRLVATTERSRSVAVVDTRAGDAVRAIATDQEGTHMVAVSPDGRIAYTANIPAGTVSVLDLAAGRKIRDVRVGGAPEAIALEPDGRTLWVGDLEGARVAAYDAAALAAADGAGLTPRAVVGVTVRNGSAEEIERAVVMPLERELRALAGIGRLHSSATDGRATLVAEFEPGTDAAALEGLVQAAVGRAGTDFPKGRTEAEVRFFGDAPIATVATGERPIRVVASPDGRWVVTSNLVSGSLTVIDTATRAKARDIVVSGSEAAGQVTILFSADGRRLYVAETGRDEVAEVDFASGAVLRRLKAGRNGDGLAIAR